MSMFVPMNVEDEEKKEQIRLNVFTWNTQGDFTAREKIAEIKRLCNKKNSVVFIQEGGVDKNGMHDMWKAFNGSAVGARNDRCTNYILINSVGPYIDKAKLIGYLADNKGVAVVGGGIAGRTPLAVEIGDVLFISWHSSASPNNEDTKILVKAVDKNQEYHKYHTVIIGGDFNSCPERIREIIEENSVSTPAASPQYSLRSAGPVRSEGHSRSTGLPYSRPARSKPYPRYDTRKAVWHYNSRKVYNSECLTHPGGKRPAELDYFIVMTKLTVVQVNTDMRPTKPSDHHMVELNIMLG